MGDPGRPQTRRLTRRHARRPARGQRQARGAGSDGFSLPIAVVAALLMLIGLAALGTRSSQGFLAIAFQGVNREARDVAESAISDFAVTLNREENRRLLVAGNDQVGQWGSNAVHSNLCTGTFVNCKYVAGTALGTSANRFMRSATWQNLVSGDSTRQFLVEDVSYRYEDRTAGSERTNFNFATVDANIPSHTVRNAALQGGTRTLLRVTIQGRVQRDGPMSQARVTREFEVVPKCCKRSFGKHSGLGVGESDPAWGTDPVAECPLAMDDGVGRGIIGSLNGGGPSSSNNTLDMVDEENNLVTRALCWGGNLTEASELGGTPNADCLSGQQALGRASKNKPGVTFVPMPFDLVLPRPRFGDGSGAGADGGWIGSQSGVQNPTLLAAAHPTASFGNWVVTDSGKYWMKTFGTWTLFDAKSAVAPAAATTPSFAGCSASLFGSCRSEPFLGAAPFPRADTQPFGQWPTAFPQPSLTITGDTRIYLDPATLTVQRQVGTGTPQPMTNCIVSKDPAAAYAVAYCRFREIASGNQTLTIDTTYAMVNFHFDDTGFTGEYMGGGGNTTIRRVHCARLGYSPASCNQLVTWSEFQRKCNPSAGSAADPNCTTRNDAYHYSELFNAYGHGAGSFTLQGSAATVGLNIYAPRASVELRGGGNADPNFMGRMWTNNIYINGNSKVRTPRSNPSFCANHRCPPPAKIPLYDVIARSFSHASGF